MESTMSTVNTHQAKFTNPRDFTMLSKLPITAVLLAAAATAFSQECTIGPTQCCNAFVQANDPVASLLSGLLGLNVNPAVKVGITCSPANNAETW